MTESSEIANWAVIVGVPTALGLCAWGLSEIIASGKTIQRMLGVLEGIQKDVNRHDTRITKLEDRNSGQGR